MVCEDDFSKLTNLASQLLLEPSLMRVIAMKQWRLENTFDKVFGSSPGFTFHETTRHGPSPACREPRGAGPPGRTAARCPGLRTTRPGRTPTASPGRARTPAPYP